MNKQIFNQLGGFPLETDNLDWMQSAYDIFNALGYIAGDKTIISGCVETGGSVSNGIVFLNGEVFKFVGGVKQATVRILENETTKVFENGNTNVVHKERYVTFATGTGSINWSDFQSINSIKNIQSRILPPGTNPQLYSGDVNSIPNGWQLCDGTNGTPDLQSRFIVGYDPTDPDYDAIGDNGGSKKVTPSGSNSNEDINVTVSKDGWGTTGGPLGSVGAGRLVVGSGINENAEALESLRAAANDQALTGSHSHTFTGAEQENRPPYYVLAYIIYTG